MHLTFCAPLWQWQGKAAWFFISLPVEDSGLIRMAVPRKAGFGSVRVKARIGESMWSTSIFPDTKSGAYLLPIKAEVRKREGLVAGDAATVTLSLDL